MWIFDSYFKGCVEMWSRDRRLERISAAYPPSFYMYLKDPHAHWEMIQAPEKPVQGRGGQLQYNIRHFRGPQDLRQQESGRAGSRPSAEE
jgi:hypothetical protein